MLGSNSVEMAAGLSHLRGLLPPIPHAVEKMSLTDGGRWSCVINVALLTSGDCKKWLNDFQEITKTSWKEEKNLSLQQQNNGEKLSLWGMMYRCSSSPSSPRQKVCTAKLEMRLESTVDSKPAKKFPCTVNIHFHHNHKTLLYKPTNGGRVYRFQDVSLVPPRQQQVEGFMMISEDVRKPEQVVQALELPPAVGDQATPQAGDAILENNIIVPPSALPRDSPNCSAETKNFYQVIQTMWVLLQKGGEATAAVDQFAERLVLLQTRQHDGKLLEHLRDFGEEPDGSPTEHPQSKTLSGSEGEFEEAFQGATTSKNKQQLKRSRCGSCKACLNYGKVGDCKECRNCLDQKRNGGPGRLKKACLMRISHNAPCPSEAKNLPTEIPLPLHPVPMSTISKLAISGNAKPSTKTFQHSKSSEAQLLPTNKPKKQA